MAYTNAADDRDARTSATPRTWTACSPGFDREQPHTTTPTAGSTRAVEDAGGAPGSATRESDGTAPSACESGASGRGESHGSRRRRRSIGDPEHGRDAAAPALRVPGPQAALRPLHPGDGRARSAASRRELFREVCRAADRELRPRPHHAPSSTRSAGPSTRSACSTSAPRRSCRLLLGNIGRPGGGILALRGHASIQGSTDIPTLFNLLPGYIPMPHAHEHQDLDTLRRRRRRRQGLLGRTWRLHGQPAQGLVGRRGHRGQRLLLRLPAPADRQPQHLRDRDGQIDGACKGYFLVGENPAVGSANAKMQRLGMAKLDWLVVRDFSLIESATWWKDGPEIETGELRTEDIATEVFFLPAAAHTEKNGSFTNTQRMLQWHHQAVEPAGDARSDLWFYYHLGRLIREKLAGSTDEMDRPAAGPDLGLPDRGRACTSPSAEAVLAEINGWDADGEPAVRLHRARRDDGSTACGCWIYCGVYADGVNQAARRKPGARAELGGTGVGLGVAGQPAHPLQPGLRRPGRAGRGASARPTSGGTTAQGKWTGHDVPDFERRQRRRTTGRPTDATAPDAIARHRPVHHAGRRQGAGCSRRPGWPTARCRPTTSRRSRRSTTRSTGSSATRPARRSRTRRTTATSPSGSRAGQRRVPVRVHHLPADRAPHRGRHEPVAALPVRAAAGDLLRGLARSWPPSGAWSTWAGPRSSRRARAIEARVLVTERMTPLTVRRAHGAPDRPALPLGPERAAAPATPPTSCSSIALDPNVHIQEAKALTCDIRPGRRPRGPACRAGGRVPRRAGITETTGTDTVTSATTTSAGA